MSQSSQCVNRVTNNKIIGWPVYAFLERSPHWFRDGTFKTAPSIFFQLYTILAFVNITMLIMIVYYYVYKRLQQFQTRLTGLRKDLVTVKVHFYVLYLCVHAIVCACLLCCLLCVCMSNILSCLLLWNLFYGVQCSMVSSVFTHFRIYIYSSS